MKSVALRLVRNWWPVLVLLAGISVFLIRQYVKMDPDPAQPATATNVIPPEGGQIVVNPMAENAGFKQEIKRLQELYLQAPAGSFMRTRLALAIGETCVKYGRIADAIVSFEKVIKDQPNEKRSHYYLGQLHLAQKDTTKATAYWRRYLELDPDSYLKDSIHVFLQRMKGS